MALCEVQGYTYAAYRAMSYLARRLGKNDKAVHWDHVADTLQTNFLRHFWWEQEQVFYMGLPNTKNLAMLSPPMQDNACGQESFLMIWRTRSCIA